MKLYCCVDKNCWLIDRPHAPYMEIEAESPSKAKSEYVKYNPDTKYIDVLVRISRKGSFNH